MQTSPDEFDRPLSRRAFLAGTTLVCCAGVQRALGQRSSADGVVVNDVHSQLNRTRVASVLQPKSRDALAAALRDQRVVAVSGARHAMGGQQFRAGKALLDMRALNRIIRLDEQNGWVEAEAGINWVQLIQALEARQLDRSSILSIRQKQTGADQLTLGGSLAANAHGRGLTRPPMISDVESFTLLDADGAMKTCSRTENSNLFALAIGGYGLFGVIYSVKLRLQPRHKLRRIVEVRSIDGLCTAFDERVRTGCEYGDFQFTIDPASEDFLQRGVFACYEPVPDDTPMDSNRKELAEDTWAELVYLAHVDKGKAFDLYAQHYQATSGQVYWSDRHQLSPYLDDYHTLVDRRTQARQPGSEMITELYVPPEALSSFMAQVADDFRTHRANVIYGTVRIIEPDTESFLPWARRRFACVIFNLHTAHDPASVKRTAGHFRRLIDRAIQHDGSFYLTYHRFATRKQVEACYPEFREFLRLKRVHDPHERFVSDWYAHYKNLLG